MDFLKNSENLVLNFGKTKKPQLCSWVLWEQSQELQILCLNATAQLFFFYFWDVTLFHIILNCFKELRLNLKNLEEKPKNLKLPNL